MATDDVLRTLLMPTFAAAWPREESNVDKSLQISIDFFVPAHTAQFSDELLDFVTNSLYM